MSKRLGRVLRLRKLREESCRVELESASQRLARIERTMASLRDQANDSRQGAFTSVNAGDASEWMLHETAREFSEWQAERLSAHQQAEAATVDSIRGTFLESRKETGQVESLLKTYEARLRMQQARREQAALDEWFNLRRQQTESARSRKLRQAGDSDADADP